MNKELKVLCYDQLILLQQTQTNIQILQQEINKRNSNEENEENEENDKKEGV